MATSPKFSFEITRSIPMPGIMASDAAIAASLALQFGCPVEVLRKALSRDARGNASSPIGVALDRLAAAEGKP
jgi:hypothetical protein